ncbi:MAG: FAD-dependent oxidoreductase [Nanoarchaeota archaeon]
MENITASVLETEFVSKNIRLIRMIPYGKIDFIPGQAIALKIKDETRHFYVTTPPEAATLIEIMIKSSPDDKLSEYLFNNLKEGDDITISGPYGLPLSYNNIKSFTLIAIGTGITKFISLIRQIMQNRADVELNLIYSVDKMDDLAFKVELDNFAFSIGKLKNNYVVTADSLWNGYNKKIDESYIKDVIKDKDSIFCICGPNDMISAVNNFLLNIGVPEKNILQNDILENDIKN